MHFILKAINKLLRLFTLLLVVFALLFSGYMIWDNQQIINEAKNVRLELQDAKPVEEEDGRLDFGELLKINPDVKCWITLDGTEIDGPVVQGRDNYYYLNHDVFCKTSMAGSLYLDARNAPDLSDIYNMIYGHHMKGSLMFGDLDFYMDEEFFEQNTTGTLLLPGGSKPLETVAVMQVLDSTREIFNPNLYTNNLEKLCAFIEENAMHISEEAFARLKAAPQHYQVTALITCTNGTTGTRLMLLVMTEYDNPYLPDEPDEPDEPVQPDEPDEPVQPDEPDEPNEPDESDQPDEPALPEVTEIPVEPEPKQPEVHEEPAEEPKKPQAPAEKEEPQTGYDDHLVLWLAILGSSGLIFVISILCLVLHSHRTEVRKRR